MKSGRKGGKPRPGDFTPAEIQVIRDGMAAGLVVREIAAKLGRAKTGVYRISQSLGLRSKRIGKTPVVTNAILAAAARPGGLQICYDIGIDPKCVQTRCSVLCSMGLLFKAKCGWKNTRYFLTAEAAAAAEKNPALCREPEPPRRPGPTLTIAVRRGPAHLPGEPVITPQTKITIAAKPPERVFRTSTYA